MSRSAHIANQLCKDTNIDLLMASRGSGVNPQSPALCIIHKTPFTFSIAIENAGPCHQIGGICDHVYIYFMFPLRI